MIPCEPLSAFATGSPQSSSALMRALVRTDDPERRRFSFTLNLPAFASNPRFWFIHGRDADGQAVWNTRAFSVVSKFLEAHTAQDVLAAPPTPECKGR